MNKTSVEEQIALEIKQRIWKGAYPVGAHMPGQRDLVSEFGSSPVTISKALNIVRNMGLIELTPKRGTRVLPPEERTMKGAIGIVFQGKNPPEFPEPALIFNGIRNKLDGYFQHHVCIGTNEFESGVATRIVKDLAGLVFIEVDGDEMRLLIEYCRKNRVPYTVANLEGAMNYNCTWIDHKKTTETAVRVLAALGHTRIALLSRNFGKFFYRSALDGYTKGVQALDLEFDDDLIAVVESSDSTDFADAVKDLINSSKGISAIVACRDYQAYGACVACEEMGLKVGRDISIIGFDNIQTAGEQANLTTFNEPAGELGKTAAEMVMKQIAFGYRDDFKIEIEVPLVLRSSAGPVPCKTSLYAKKIVPLELFMYSPAKRFATEISNKTSLFHSFNI